jgi:hypothetical protein
VGYFITPRNQLYLDYEYAKALSYSRPWSVGAGYRLAW